MRSAVLGAAAVLLLGASLVSATIIASPPTASARVAWADGFTYSLGTAAVDVPADNVYYGSYVPSQTVPPLPPYTIINVVNGANGSMTQGVFSMESAANCAPVVIGDSAYVGDGAMLKGFRNDTWNRTDQYVPATPTWTAASALPCNVSTLTAGPGMLVAACDTGAIFAVDIASKAIRWAVSVSTGTSDASVFNVQVSWCTLTSSYTVLVFGGQSATMIDPTNGTVMWTIQNSTWPSVLPGPAPVISTDGNTVFFAAVSGELSWWASVFAVATATGDRLWSQQLNSSAVAMNLGPQIALLEELGSVIVAYLSTPGYQAPALLEGLRVTDGAPLWQFDLPPEEQTPVVIPRPMRVDSPGSSVTGQVVYCLESRCGGVDVATGNSSAWSWSIDGNGALVSPQPPGFENAFLVFANGLTRVDIVPPPAPTPAPSYLYTFCSASASCAGPSCTAEQGFVGCDGSGVKRECAAGGESLVIQQYSNPDCTGVVTKTQTLYKDICMAGLQGGSYELQSCA